MKLSDPIFKAIRGVSDAMFELFEKQYKRNADFERRISALEKQQAKQRNVDKNPTLGG